jgi:putative spermidine/putrescine transport system substrate-binding protein
VQAVYAAGLSRGGGDAAKAAEEGLNYFAELNKAGNFVPVIGKSASLAQGSRRSSWRGTITACLGQGPAGNPPVEVVVPKSGVVAGVYVQAISKFAPHPNAAKLWMEHLYSDEGQLIWLKGFCHPIRFNDLAANNKIPKDCWTRCRRRGLREAVFPTLDEQNSAKAAITEKWDSVVGANVQ